MPKIYSIEHFHQCASVAVLLISQAFAVPLISSRTSPTISWSSCNFTAADPPSLSCGSIQAPIDHSDPHGPQVGIKFARLAAPNDTRIGSLFFNPGGPGGSSTAFVQLKIETGWSIWSAELLQRYDLINFDPRGTGLSNPVSCNETIWNQRVPIAPKDDSEFAQMVERNKAFSESCKAGTGPVFDFLDTESVARDMDLIREALGEDKLNFLGLSYGTDLGTTYANIFPEKVGRMVLDGVMDQGESDTTELVTESTAYEATLNHFFQWCNTTTECALNGKDAAGIFDTLITSADINPVPAPDCSVNGEQICKSDVTGEELLSRIQSGLLGFAQNPVLVGWPMLSLAIADAAAGNATLLSAPLKTQSTSSDFSFLAIACLEWAPSSKNYVELALKRQMTGVISPHTRGSGEIWSMQSKCIGWAAQPRPKRALNPQNLAKLPNILLVTSYWDPSTSIVWANGLRLQIPNSVLILRKGSGHTTYFTFGETSKAIDKFLMMGQLPKQGMTYDS